MNKVVLSLRHVSCLDSSRDFRLRNLNFDLCKGEILCILGVDGSGKHLLLDILRGKRGADSGEILLMGCGYKPKNPDHSQKKGIFCIEGTGGLISAQTVSENLYLNRSYSGKRWIVNERLMEKETIEIIRRFELPFAPTDHVGSLSPAMKTVLEIVKYHLYDAKVIVLYGVMGSSTKYELNIFLNTLRYVTEKGAAILILSNHYHRWLDVADRMVIMSTSTGQFLWTYYRGSYDPRQLESIQVGFKYSALSARQKRFGGPEVFKLDHYSGFGSAGMSFAVHGGQAVGIFYDDIEKAEKFAAALRGDGTHTGRMYLEGREIDLKNIRQAIKNRIGYLSLSGQYFPALGEEENVLQLFLPQLCSIRGVVSKRKVQAMKRDIKEHLDYLKARYGDLTLDNGLYAQLTRFYLYPFKMIITLDTGNFDATKTRMFFEFVEMTSRQNRAMIILSPDMQALEILCEAVYFLK